MKNSLILFIVLTSQSVFSQNEFISRMNDLVKSKSMSAASKVCFVQFWNANEIENGKNSFSKFIKKEYVFTAYKDTIENNLRIVSARYTLKSSSDTGNVYFYLAQNETKNWLIEGINNDDTHYDLFLKNKIRGYFHIKQLPKHPDLQLLGEDIEKQHTLGQYRLQSILLDSSETQRDFYKSLGELKNVKLVSTHFSDSENKGLIILKHSTPEGDQQLHLYLQQINKESKVWRMYDSNRSTPHLNLFFK